MPRYQVIVRDGLEQHLVINGRVEVNPAQDLTAKEVLSVVEAEHILEKLTGFRFHITEAP